MPDDDYYTSSSSDDEDEEQPVNGSPISIISDGLNVITNAFAEPVKSVVDTVQQKHEEVPEDEEEEAEEDDSTDIQSFLTAHRVPQGTYECVLECAKYALPCGCVMCPVGMGIASYDLCAAHAARDDVDRKLHAFGFVFHVVSVDSGATYVAYGEESGDSVWLACSIDELGMVYNFARDGNGQQAQINYEDRTMTYNAADGNETTLNVVKSRTCATSSCTGMLIVGAAYGAIRDVVSFAIKTLSVVGVKGIDEIHDVDEENASTRSGKTKVVCDKIGDKEYYHYEDEKIADVDFVESDGAFWSPDIIKDAEITVYPPSGAKDADETTAPTPSYDDSDVTAKLSQMSITTKDQKENAITNVVGTAAKNLVSALGIVAAQGDFFPQRFPTNTEFAKQRGAAVQQTPPQQAAYAFTGMKNVAQTHAKAGALANGRPLPPTRSLTPHFTAGFRRPG